MRAECVETRSKAMSRISVDTLCLLLRYALERMQQPGVSIMNIWHFFGQFKVSFSRSHKLIVLFLWPFNYSCRFHWLFPTFYLFICCIQQEDFVQIFTSVLNKLDLFKTLASVNKEVKWIDGICGLLWLYRCSS